jgi:NADP-dependent 3-hydroxy acid dehydrogenase YdfG
LRGVAPHPIRVNAIAPTVTRTRLTKRSQENPEILDYLHHRQPLAKRMIDADDIARASLFLLSDVSRMVTGETLVVDAGASAYKKSSAETRKYSASFLACALLMARLPLKISDTLLFDSKQPTDRAA